MRKLRLTEVQILLPKITELINYKGRIQRGIFLFTQIIIYKAIPNPVEFPSLFVL